MENWTDGYRLLARTLAIAVLATVSMAALSASIAGAHGDHSSAPHGGRLPGQPDYKKIGKTTYRFLPGREEYEIHTEGRPPAFAHADFVDVEDAGNGEVTEEFGGPGTPLPSFQRAPICRSAGNRVVVVYTYRPGDPNPVPYETIRAIVRRMNWKIFQQSLLSSNNSRSVELPVECNGATINVYPLATANNDLSTIASAERSAFGNPKGKDAVKYLTFDPEANANAVGIGELFQGTSKSYLNPNAQNTATAVIYHPSSWETGVTIHELMHTFGSSQGGASSPPPFTAGTAHCIDGLDILCYNEFTSPPYSDTRCPASLGYETPEGVPLDCGYDTYFNTAPSPGSWLGTNWDAGGEENPFLVNPNDPLMIVQSSSSTGANANGDVRVNATLTTWGTSPASYYFQWGETTAYGKTTPERQVDYGQSNATGVLPGLDPGKAYHFRLVATRAGNTRTTPDSLVSATSPTVNGVGSTEATLRAGTNPNGIATSYQFEWGTTTSYGSKAPASPKSVGSGSEWVGVSETLTGLSPDTTYHYRFTRFRGTETIQSADKTFTTYKVPPSFSFSAASAGTGEGQLSAPGGIATNSSGDVWVADRENDRIEQFEPQGEFIRSVDGAGNGVGALLGPFAVATDGNSNVWVANTGRNNVVQFSSTGVFVRAFGESGAGSLSQPAAIDVDRRNGNVWVADTGHDRVVAFNSSGVFLRQFGSTGAGAGQFSGPRGIVVNPEGDVWVADTGNNRLEMFSEDGQFLRQVGSKGSGAGQFQAPTQIATPTQIPYDPKRPIWVADTGNHRLQQFSNTGDYVTQLGSQGTGEGQLEGPKGVAVDSKGFIWAADNTTSKLSNWGALAFNTEAATGIKTGQANLRGKIDPNGTETTYQFEYGKTTSYGTKIPASPQSVGSGTKWISVNELITGLLPSTTYHYRLAVSNGKETVQGRDRQVTTIDTRPASAVEPATQVLQHSAMLNGTVNPQGIGTRYSFEYGPTTSYGSVAAVPAPYVGSGTSPVAVSVPVTGLEYGTTYHYRITATNIEGTKVSEDGQVTTPSQAFEWWIEGKTMAERSLNEETLSVSGGPVTLAGTVAGSPLKFTCSTTGGSGKALKGGTGEATLALSGCAIVEPSSCKVASSIKLVGKAELVYGLGHTLFERYKPANGTSFGSVGIENCASEGFYPIKGSFAAKLDPSQGEVAEQPRELSAAINEASASALIVGGNAAALSGSFNVRLNGANPAAPWGPVGDGEWRIEGKTMAERGLGEEDLSASGGPITLAGTVAGSPLKFTCSTTSGSGKAFKGGGGEAALSLSSCSVAEPSSCQIGEPVRLRVAAMPMLFAAIHNERLEPYGATFGSVGVENCASEGFYPVKGSFTGRGQLASAETVSQPREFSTLIDQSTGSAGLTIGGNAATVSGSLGLSLAGANAGRPWGG
jgi:hypothetical protein